MNGERHIGVTGAYMAMVTYRGVHGRRYVGVYKDTLPLGHLPWAIWGIHGVYYTGKNISGHRSGILSLLDIHGHGDIQGCTWP